jgi:hypothetical protein
MYNEKENGILGKVNKEKLEKQHPIKLRERGIRILQNLNI